MNSAIDNLFDPLIALFAAQIPGSVNTRAAMKLERIMKARLRSMYYAQVIKSLDVAEIVEGVPIDRALSTQERASWRTVMDPRIAKAVLPNRDELIRAMIAPMVQAYFESALQIARSFSKQARRFSAQRGVFKFQDEALSATEAEKLRTLFDQLGFEPFPVGSFIVNPEFNTAGFIRPVPAEAIEWAIGNAAGLVAGIQDADINRLSEIISGHLSDPKGHSVDELARLVKADMPNFSRVRATLIANMEINNSVSQGALAQAKKRGASRKEAITVGDNQVREEHTTNEGDGRIPISQAFSGTGDITTPFGFNCRCAVNFVGAVRG